MNWLDEITQPSKASQDVERMANQLREWKAQEEGEA